MSIQPSFVNRLVLLILAVFATILIIVVFAALSNWREETLRGFANTQTEFEQLLTSKSGLERQVGAFRTTAQESLFWSAEHEGSAVARIQTALSQSASASNISFRSITPLPTQELSGISKIGVRLEFEADQSQLVTFLREVEFHEPILVVERAALRRVVRNDLVSTQPTVFSQLDVVAPTRLGDRS